MRWNSYVKRALSLCAMRNRYRGKGSCTQPDVLALLVVFLSGTFCLAAQESPPRTVHVFVALADNQHQGIVPVPARLGNGDDPDHNLYWGSAYGLKTFFARSAEWSLAGCTAKPKAEVLERCIFRHRATNTYIVGDAYRGSEIRSAVLDFFDAASGAAPETIAAPTGERLRIRGGANVIAYIGHNGLMDFQLPLIPKKKDDVHRDVIILACASKQYFAEVLRVGGARPLLWTTNLMAPEAYTLKSALDGWIAGENGAQIRDRAVTAYDKYQKCGLNAARRLFATGW
jgi:hypothetical protein